MGRESGMEAPFVGETGPVRVKFQGSWRWKASAVRSRALAQSRTHSFAKNANEWGTRIVLGTRLKLENWGMSRLSPDSPRIPQQLEDRLNQIGSRITKSLHTQMASKPQAKITIQPTSMKPE